MTDTNTSNDMMLSGALAPTFAGAVEGATVEAIAELAREGSKPEILLIPTDGLGRGPPPRVPVLFNRHLQEVIPLLDHIHAARPDMERTGTANVLTIDSFIALVLRHADPGQSAIFADTEWPHPALTAVIDYHSVDQQAGYCKHRIRYPFPVTKEFTDWINNNEKTFSQMEFARFVEAHIRDLSLPEQIDKVELETAFRDRFALPNEVADLARDLEVHVKSTVKDGGRQKSGTRAITFIEEHNTAAGEPLDVPGLFWIALRPFLSGDGPGTRVGIPVRLFYRVKDGSVSWSYQMYGWEEILRKRVQRDLMRAAKETGLPAYEGKPEILA